MSVAPSPPVDPVLQPVAVALDGSAVAEVLARHLPVRVESCTPRYVKYRPGRQCVVLYEIALEDATTTLGHATVLGARRADRLWARLAGSGLAERAARLHPELSVGTACRLPELGAVLQLFPVDVRLPGLTEATSRSAMRTALGEALVSLELVRYKPGRRAVLRYRLDSARYAGGLRKAQGRQRGRGAGRARERADRAGRAHSRPRWPICPS